MGLLDTVRSLFCADGASLSPDTFGPVARSYVETGDAPDETWAAAERDGRVNVLVTAVGEPTPEQPVETDAVEAHLRRLDGHVEHAHGGGTVSGWMDKARLADLAAHAKVARVEVTRPGGDVTDDPDYPG
jgi:hypothetical protein